MKYTIHVGNKPIVLEHGNLDDLIDVDSLTIIDVSNIFGEAVTISAAANRIGMLKAEVEERLSQSKLDLKVFEADFKAQLRAEANNNGGKFNIRFKRDAVDTDDPEDVDKNGKVTDFTEVKITEKALETSFENDPEWIKVKQRTIQDENIVGKLASLYWAVQDKARKLNNLTTNVTPEEFVGEMVEGKVNGILIKKVK